MDSNPYAPPKAVVSDHPGSVAGLKRRGVLVMLALTVMTLGLYYPLWFFRRRTALNQLNSPRKVQQWPVILFVTVLAIETVVVVLSDPDPPARTIGAPAALFLAFARAAVAILMLWQCFRIKDILEDHIARPADEAGPVLFSGERVTLSGVMTFFFSIYYLQYVINRHIAVSE